MTSLPAGALHGLRVIDLTQMLAGPFCTMLLADLGADVIKVEPPEGEFMRRQGPFPITDGPPAYGGFFQSINRNKRGIVLDLTQEADRATLLKLVSTADVVIENYRLGVMERFGLGYEEMREVNPRIVYACIRGFGDPRTGESPYADWPAFDIVAQAVSGLMSTTGPGPGHPMKVGPGVGDIVPGMLCAVGVLAAVRHADRTGEGQFVDVAMSDGLLAMCERLIYRYSYAGDVSEPEGNNHPTLCPFDMFPAKDGAVTIAAPVDNLWRALCEIMGRPDLGSDERLAVVQGRSQHAAEVRAAISEWTSARTIAELATLLGGKVPFGPVNSVADIMDDPHVAARGMVQYLEHPGTGRSFAVAGSPIKLTVTPSTVRHRAPLLGEHTAEVLREAGIEG
jgi:crotonobetainyl-CoA:carnitine CoA-transferase CaiB-like acyl-CoA transferase